MDYVDRLIKRNAEAERDFTDIEQRFLMWVRFWQATPETLRLLNDNRFADRLIERGVLLRTARDHR